MKSLLLILSLTLLSYCSQTKEADTKTIINTLKSLNLTRLEGVRIESRNYVDGKWDVQYFLVQAGSLYVKVPNFKHHTFEDLNDSNKYSLLRIASIAGVENEEAINYIKSYSKVVIQEYHKSGMTEILSDSSICDCILFFPDNDHFIAYVPDKKKVYKEYWKNKLVKSNNVESMWYAGKKSE